MKTGSGRADTKGPPGYLRQIREGLSCSKSDVIWATSRNRRTSSDKYLAVGALRHDGPCGMGGLSGLYSGSGVSGFSPSLAAPRFSRVPSVRSKASRSRAFWAPVRSWSSRSAAGTSSRR